jgi:hypothetical protein
MVEVGVFSELRYWNETVSTVVVAAMLKVLDVPWVMVELCVCEVK